MSRALLLAAALCPLVTGQPFLSGQEPALQRSALPVDAATFNLLSADFDGDGDDDLAVRETDAISVFRHGGRGSFELLRRWTLEAGHRGGVRALKLDGDGFADLVRGNFLSLTVSYGRGDGSFEGTIDVPARDEVRHFALADFDADGLKDIVYCGGEVGAAGVMLARPGRKFDAEIRIDSPVRQPHLVLPGDFNGDGRLDFGIWGRGTLAGLPPFLVILEGLGGGSFRSPVDVDSGLLDPRLGGVLGEVADLDNDRRDDIVLIAPEAAPGAILRVAGSVESQYEVALVEVEGAGIRPQGLLLPSDADGDGWPDLITHGSAEKLAWILRNPTDGSFDLRDVCPVSLSNHPASVAAGDFNGDGTIDLAAAVPEESLVEVIWSPLEQCGVASDCFRGVFTPVDPCYSEALRAEELPAAHLAVGVFGGGNRREILAVGEGVARFLVPAADDFLEEGRVEVPVASSGMTTGDLDGDGHVDFALSDLAAGKVSVFYLNGARELRRPAEELLTGLLPRGLLAGDLNRDDVPDLAVALAGDGQVAVFDGLGGGAFARARRFDALPRARSIALGDFDGDGWRDLVVTGEDLQEVAVLRGLGDGAFDAPEGVVTVADARSLAVADLDRNGLDDIVAASFRTGGVTLLLSQGADFRPGVLSLPRGSRTTDIQLEDLNQDGLPEIVAANSGDGTLRIFPALGGGEYGQRATALCIGEENLTPFTLAVADVDGDGLADLISGGEDLILFHSEGCNLPVFRRGDVDQDAVLRLTDAVRVLNHLFIDATEIPCPDAADADDDGLLTVTDAIVTLNYLFLGGATPQPPGPELCGEDPTEDALGPCSGSCP